MLLATGPWVWGHRAGIERLREEREEEESKESKESRGEKVSRRPVAGLLCPEALRSLRVWWEV